MNLILNFPKDKTNIEDGVVLFKAILISRYIENLDCENNERQKIKDNLIKKLIEIEQKKIQ